MFVSFGDTAESISNLVRKDKKTAVVYTKAVTAEEIQVENEVISSLNNNDLAVPLWSASVKHIDDFSFEFHILWFD